MSVDLLESHCLDFVIRKFDLLMFPLISYFHVIKTRLCKLQGHHGILHLHPGERGFYRYVMRGQTQYIFEKSKNILNLGHFRPQKYTHSFMVHEN